jgi:endoglucanase
MFDFSRRVSASLVLYSTFVVACGSGADAADDPTTQATMPLAFGSGDGTVIEAEAMSLPSSAGKVFADTSASAGQALLVWSNATATITRTTDAVSIVRVRARGDQCNGAPRLIVRVDGSTVLSVLVPSTSWTNYESSGIELPAGSHLVEIVYENNNVAPATCDRNLRIDRLNLVSNPFAGARFYVDPNSLAKQQADTWRSTRPADAAQMDKLAQSAWSRWFGNWNTDITGSVRRDVDAITAAGALPVLVAYNIPNRDCGGGSGGGAGSSAAYRTWIDGFGTGIGGRRAVVILEPDALALACAGGAGNDELFALLRDAVSLLSRSGNVAVYLDAGHSNWVPAATMASRLRSSGVGSARGFSINVSNFRPTADEIAYGNAVVQALGMTKRFVIDTSRNGLGYNGEWCNPAGRALGVRATAATGNASVDAFYWIKTPGLSDGTCNGGPAAGTWWPEYALGLAQRAAY